jgi:hypothetical protein
VRSLDWDIRSAVNKDNIATRIRSNLDNCANALLDYQRFLNDAHTIYTALDNWTLGSNVNTGATICSAEAIVSALNQAMQTKPAASGMFLVHGTLAGWGAVHGRDDGTEHWYSCTVRAHRENFDYVNNFAWSGRLCPVARQIAANRLASELLTFINNNSGAPIHIKAYSHGGNVAINAINMLHYRGVSQDVLDMIHLNTFGTPGRWESRYRLSADIGSHRNFYNTDDGWQRLGGTIPKMGYRNQPGADNINAGGSGHGTMHNDLTLQERQYNKDAPSHPLNPTPVPTPTPMQM